ncbi:hypothetical protein F2Q69_00036348 [Brassica cretica]|uniref:Uncharacterized protein n=1 Tax=Brassica cretica TaxID=69181 RepID=A0A8S9SW42_BRACR|nr:hypothetical protein F2Q69_00036348 [Brassica cretica]
MQRMIIRTGSRLPKPGTRSESRGQDQSGLKWDVVFVERGMRQDTTFSFHVPTHMIWEGLARGSRPELNSPNDYNTWDCRDFTRCFLDCYFKLRSTMYGWKGIQCGISRFGNQRIK